MAIIIIHIDWQSFTPMSLIGGMLIGISVVLLLLVKGKLAGISGIVSYLVRPSKSQSWHWLFIIGLISAPLVYRLFAPLPQMQVTDSIPLLVISGLLVGYGTRLGSGCTSGHGICGNARLSQRSFMATISFMAAGMITVAVVRYLFSLNIFNSISF